MPTLVSGGEKVWRVLDRGKILDGGNAQKRFWVDARYPGHPSGDGEKAYAANVAHWDFLDRSYRGGRDYKKAANLFPFVMELSSLRGRKPGKEVPSTRSSKTSFDVRVDQSFRINLCASMVDELLGYLASKEPDRAPLDGPLAKLGEYVRAVDRERKTGLDNFSIKTARNLLTRGIDYRPTDMRMTEEEINEFFRSRGLRPPQKGKKGELILNSDADRRALGLLPFSWHVHPANVVQARFDSNGNLLSVLINEKVDSGKELDDEAGGGPGLVSRYRFWTSTRWVLYEVQETARAGKVTRRELVELAGGVNLLGAVPVAVQRFKPHDEDPYRGIGFLDDLAELDRGLFNMWMALIWGLKESAASQTIVKTTLPSVHQKGKMDETREAYRGAMTEEIAIIDREDEADTLTRDFAQGAVLLESAKALLSTIAQLSGFRDKADAQVFALSGVAFQRAFANLNALLARLGGLLGETELVQLRTAAQFLTIDPEEVTEACARWPSSYDLRSVDDVLAAITALKAAGAPAALMKKLMKDFVGKFFADLGPEERDELFAAIDEWEEADLVDASRLKKDGQHPSDEEEPEELEVDEEAPAVAAAS